MENEPSSKGKKIDSQKIPKIQGRSPAPLPNHRQDDYHYRTLPGPAHDGFHLPLIEGARARASMTLRHNPFPG
jgi:hypothetical protein